MTRLRPARADEAPALSALALRSKGHWGYSADFLRACRAELTYTEVDCRGGLLIVAEQEKEPAGFYLLGTGEQSGESQSADHQLREPHQRELRLGEPHLEELGEPQPQEPHVGELRALFVDPPLIGTGLGRELLLAALRHARDLGWTALRLDADPGAEPFYAHHGARRIGSAPSGSIPGRELPRLQFDLAEVPTRRAPR